MSAPKNIRTALGDDASILAEASAAAQEAPDHGVDHGPRTPSPDDDIPAATVQTTIAKGRRRGFGWTALAVVGILLVGGGGVVLVAKYILSGDPSAVPQTSVAKSTNVADTPGATDLPPSQSNAYATLNNQKREKADETRTSFTSIPVFDRAVPLTPAPQPPAPVYAPARPVAPAPINTSDVLPPDDPHWKLMREALAETRKKAGQDRGLGGSVIDHNPVFGAATPVNATGADTANASRRNGGPEDMGETLALPHQAYAMNRNAANSDVPAPVAIDIVSGPLVGGLLYGKPVYNQKNMSMALERMSFGGIDYKVDALVLDPDTLSPALDVDVENHYGERILVPGVAAAIGAVGKALSTAGTVTTYGTMTSTSQTSPLDTKQVIGAGIGGAGDAASRVLQQDASQIKPTVKFAANKPVIVVFMRAVRSGDRIK